MPETTLAFSSTVTQQLSGSGLTWFTGLLYLSAILVALAQQTLP